MKAQRGHSIQVLIRAENMRRRKELTKLLEGLRSLVENLPDNPRIKRLSTQAFVVSFSGLGSNRTPECHDFKWCYRRVAETISEADDPIAELREIIREERVVAGKGNSRYVARLHPDVVFQPEKIRRQAMRKQDVKRTLPQQAAVTLQSIVELEAALQSGGCVNNESNKKERNKE